MSRFGIGRIDRGDVDRTDPERRRNYRAAPGYLEKLRALCDARSILLIFDEAQIGLGRVGANFSLQQEGVVPDILSLSKTLGADIPLSATVVRWRSGALRRH
ncbi:MAG: aminotransferase class III-fold pyridoxal phosphate-dependent enzyme [Gammaproteobacteria bacterium]|nr:aminotransferase class III-fold pyridoxal phosphate-dependent enzyme [Gammaproteobacteria bacterium]